MSLCGLRQHPIPRDSDVLVYPVGPDETVVPQFRQEVPHRQPLADRRLVVADRPINPHRPPHLPGTTQAPRMSTLPDEAPGLPHTAVEDGRELHGLECVVAVTILAPSHTHVAVDADDARAAAT